MSVTYGLVARYPPDPCKRNAEKNPTKRDAVRGRSRVGIFQLGPAHCPLVTLDTVGLES